MKLFDKCQNILKESFVVLNRSRKSERSQFFSGCPPSQRGALGAGYNVPGWRARRLVFNTIVKIRNSCLLSNLIPGQMDMKSVPICAVKQVIVVAGRKSWSITFATSKPGAIIRMEIKIGFTACLAHQVFSHFFSSFCKRPCIVLTICKVIN